MTPRARVCGAIADSALNAPRNLNEPVRWKFSHLKNTVAPEASSTVREVMTGVRRACPSMRRPAASTSPWVGSSAKRRDSEQAKVRPENEDDVESEPQHHGDRIVEAPRRHHAQSLRPVLE